MKHNNKMIYVIILIISIFVGYKLNIKDIFQPITINKSKIYKTYIKEDESAEYTEFNTGDFPDSRYTLDKSVCQNGGVITRNNDNSISGTFEKADHCTLYFSLNKVFNFGYTGGEQTFVVPKAGIYKLETWGAQGGSTTEKNNNGGTGGYAVAKTRFNKNDRLYINIGGQGTAGNLYDSKYSFGGTGGYSVGNIQLNKTSILYIVVGSLGVASVGANNSPGGYNGGGIGRFNNDQNSGSEMPSSVGSGGGATHIANTIIGNGQLKNFYSYLGNLLLVSGGGGGGNYWPGDNLSHIPQNGIGGSGGGYIGVNGTTSSNHVIGKGGTQINGGTGGTSGSFGFGASFLTSTVGAAGGGGGFYGGGSSSDNAGGGGGSGYIGNQLLTDKHMACYNCETSNEESTKTISVTCASETPTADCAKIGNGYARITYIDN